MTLFNQQINVVIFVAVCLFMATPAMAAKKKPRDTNPKIKVVNVVPLTKNNTPKSHTSRKQMYANVRAAIARGKPALKQAQKNLVAVEKSELRNRKDRIKAKKPLSEAQFAVERNRTPGTVEAYNRALAKYLPFKQRHEASQSMLTSAENRVVQAKALNRKSAQALREIPRLAIKPAAPRFDRASNFASPKSAYDRAPAPAAIYGAGPAAAASQNRYTAANDAMFF